MGLPLNEEILSINKEELITLSQDIWECINKEEYIARTKKAGIYANSEQQYRRSRTDTAIGLFTKYYIG